jgi:ABC-type nitrate/sulfonate/bicarbonate transport system substrate-binding protein
LIAAKELGIFEEEGEDVEIVTIRPLGDVESLRDGAVDFSAGTAHAPLMILPERHAVDACNESGARKTRRD